MRKIAYLALLFFLLMGSNDLAISQSGTYKVGDKGPAGGIIIWSNVTPTAEGWQYIEVAPEDQGKAEWGCYGKNIKSAERKFELFDGKKNTEAILKECPNAKTAAKLASNYRGGGKSDWHLPASDEMRRIRLSLVYKKMSNLEPGYYWTSTQDSEVSEGTFVAFIFHYGIDHMVSANKYSQARVRAVRYF